MITVKELNEALNTVDDKTIKVMLVTNEGCYEAKHIILAMISGVNYLVLDSSKPRPENMEMVVVLK